MRDTKSLPFHIKPLEDNANVVISRHNKFGTKYNELPSDIWYSFDNKKYKKYDGPINVRKNQLVYFKGNNTTLGNINTNNNGPSKDTYFTNFTCKNIYTGYDVKYNVYGNITSLLDPNNYSIPIPAACFKCFFMCQNIVDASKLYLPSDDIGRYAYESMFEHCKNLKHAPKDLPASHVPQQAYSRMFKDCVSLKTVPKIHAKSFNRLAFLDMFDVHDNSNLRCITKDSNPVHFSKEVDTVFKRYKLDLMLNANMYRICHLKHLKDLPFIKFKFDL